MTDKNKKAAPRAYTSGTISFGMVSIGVKLYTATSSEKVSFNMLHPKSHARLKQQLYSPEDDEVVDRKEVVRGYEIEKNKFIVFEDEELKALEAEKTNTIEILEFVPAEEVDFIFVDKTYYLGPGKGSDKSYAVFVEAMKQEDKVAIGRYVIRGKECMVMVRPYENGLIFHQLFYANEVRPFENIPIADGEFSDKDLKLARNLVDALSAEEFAPEQYENLFNKRLKEAIEQKQKGEAITVSAPVADSQLLDLTAALEASVKNKKKTAKKKKKKSSRKKKTA